MRTRRLTQYATILAFLVLTGGLLWYLVGQTGTRVEIGKHPYRIDVQLPTAVQLVPNSDVRASGVKVGAVTAVEREEDGTARVRIRIDHDGAKPIARDATVQVRTKTLLGENYLELVPGTRAAGTVPSGGTLALRQADPSVQIDDILSSLDADTRREVRRSLARSALAVSGRSRDLNQALGALQPTVESGGRVLRTVAEQRRDLDALVRQTGRVLETVSARGDDLERFVRQGRRAGDAVAVRDRELAAAVRELPTVLAPARRATRALARFSADAARPIDELGDGVQALAPTVRDLRPTARATTALLRDVPSLARRLDPLLTSLERTTRTGGPLVAPLERTLRELNPALAYLAPYAREFGAFFGNVGSANNERDSLGHMIRVYPVVNAATLNVPGPLRKVIDDVLEATGIDQVNQLRTNLYPRPGTVGAPERETGTFPKLPTVEPQVGTRAGR